MVVDNNAVARAVLQHHNTPLPDCQLSPAQLLFGNPLKDFLPAHPSYYNLHPKWLELRHLHSTNIRERTEHVRKHYNSTAHNLKPLAVGQQVFVQNKTKRSHNLWNQTGVVTHALPYRQYKVKLDSTGNTRLRNRRFLKPVPQTCRHKGAATPFSSLSPTSQNMSIYPLTNQPDQTQENNTVSSTRPNFASDDVGCRTNTVNNDTNAPRMLQNLSAFNNPGRQETLPPPVRLRSQARLLQT